MHRVDTSTAAAALPASDAAGVAGYFTKGDPGIPTPATVPGQDWFNAVQEELIAVVVEGGGVPDTAKANFTQLRDAIKAIIGANPSTPRGYIDGLTLSNNGTVAIDIAAGVARDGGDAADMALAAALTDKQLNVAWAVGAAAGMLDTGAIAATTWYHIWEIQRSDTGVVDVLASLSATAPTMPASYDRKRRIGAVLTDATPDIIAFSQDGDKFLWDVRALDISDTTPGTTANTGTISTPLGIVTDAMLSLLIQQGQNANLLVTSLDQTDTTPSLAYSDVSIEDVSGGRSVSEVIRKTNTSSQIRYRSDDGTLQALTIATLGWIDPRGRNA